MGSVDTLIDARCDNLGQIVDEYVVPQPFAFAHYRWGFAAIERAIDGPIEAEVLRTSAPEYSADP